MTYLRLTIIFVLVACALMAGAYSAMGKAGAQGMDPDVDLEVRVKVNAAGYADGTLINHGRDAAYGVVVELKTPGYTTFVGEPPLGTIVPQPGDDTTILWRIPRLPGNSLYSYEHNPVTSSATPPFIIQFLAKVTSDSPEAAELQNNNEAEAWAVWTTRDDGDTAQTNLSVQADVDNAYPSPDGMVQFTITSEALDGHSGAIVRVEVSLTEGLTYQSHAITRRDTDPQTTTFTFNSGTGIGIWDIGVWARKPDSFELTLTGQLANNSVVNRQCLTATLIPKPLDSLAKANSLADNTDAICLGEPPTSALPVLFQEGQTDLITLYDCVGNATYPCDSSDSLEWAAQGGTAAREAGLPYRIFQPGDVVVHVPDTLGLGRHVDSNDMPVWSTGYRHEIGNEVAFFREGVIVSDNFRLLDKAKWGVPPSCPPGAPPPVCASVAQQREVNFIATISGPDPRTSKARRAGGHDNEESVEYTLYDFDSTTGIHDDSRTIGSGIPGYYEFGALGTYTVEVTVTAKHNNSTPSDNTDDVDYTTPAATYTFHVGPIAELEVRDAGQNPALPAGQRAYTIMAVNNGPDTAPAAQVTLSNLDAASCTAGAATKGATAFAGSECTWTIGKLIAKDVSQITRGRDGEVLTIITSDAVDTKITATITNTQDYQVCIDSSGEDVDATSDSCSSPNTWHTAKYYDYISDNSTDVTIQAKEGTGADLPSVQTPQAETAAIIVSWEPVTEVNGRTVTHYQVQRETNPWVTVADNVPAGTTKYVDTDVTAGVTYRYQVRAVNDQDQAGPWSVPIEGTATMMEPEVVTRTETVFRDRVVTETETITVGENPFAYFADEETTRTVAENSAPGSPVGAPVTVIRNSGNKVVYSLEGPDAALFTIEEDTGQILVGEGALLDFESGTTSYTVEVVADPRSGADVRTTVTITVVDIAETGFVFIDPPGAPQVGAPLFASLMHTEGEPVEPRWQWQRSMPDGAWADIPGAIQETYTPSDLDAGRRLRALVVFGNPLGDGEGRRER